MFEFTRCTSLQCIALVFFLFLSGSTAFETMAQELDEVHRQHYVWFHIEKVGIAFQRDLTSMLQAYDQIFDFRFERVTDIKCKPDLSQDLCVNGVRSVIEIPPTRLLVVVRDPYTHSRSLYHHYTRSIKQANLVPEFEDWIREWAACRTIHQHLENSGEALERACREMYGLNTYYRPPINFQYNLIKEKLHDLNQIRPDPGLPISVVMHAAYFTGVTALMHESLCVLAGKLSLELNVSSLPHGCDCRDRSAWDAFSVLMSHDDKANSHAVDHSKDDAAFSPDTLSTIDRANPHEWELYHVALQMLSQRGKHIEGKFNTKIFCDETMPLPIVDCTITRDVRLIPCFPTQCQNNRTLAAFSASRVRQGSVAPARCSVFETGINPHSHHRCVCNFGSTL